MKIIRTLLTFLLFAFVHAALAADVPMLTGRDRKSTRLNSSH